MKILSILTTTSAYLFLSASLHAADFTLSEKSGLNNLGTTIPLTLKKIKQNAPKYEVKKNTAECETGTCTSIVIQGANINPIAVIEGNGEEYSVIRVANAEVATKGFIGKLGDSLDSMPFAKTDKSYKKYCTAGMEAESGNIICHTLTNAKTKTVHIRHIFTGENGLDGALPPLRDAKKFKIKEIIWNKK